MSDETKHAAAEAIDINSPDLQVAEIDIDTEKDQFASMPVVAAGTYRAKLKLKKPKNDIDSFWVRGYTKKGNKPYLQTAIEARIIAGADGKFDDWPLFDNFVSTMVQEMTGTNRIVGILKALGQQVPARVSESELARMLDSALSGEPECMITVDWEGYCETCEKTVVKSEKRFPVDKNTGARVPALECPKDGTTVNAQAKILKYLPVA